MAITWARSTSEGQWLGASGAPWWQAVGYGPTGFEAYARVRYIPDPVRPGMAEADVELPEDHPRDLDQGRAALAVLAAFTSTPQDCWFAVWEGCSSSLELPAGLPALELPHRRYGLLRGALTDLASWEETVHTQLDAPPAFVSPVDRGGASPATVPLSPERGVEGQRLVAKSFGRNLPSRSRLSMPSRLCPVSSGIRR